MIPPLSIQLFLRHKSLPTSFPNILYRFLASGFVVSQPLATATQGPLLSAFHLQTFSSIRSNSKSYCISIPLNLLSILTIFFPWRRTSASSASQVGVLSLEDTISYHESQKPNQTHLCSQALAIHSLHMPTLVPQ